MTKDNQTPTIPRVSMIVAATRDWAIGRDGHLLYRISEDLRRFRKLTTGNVIIMGYNTYAKCVGRTLPDRVNYVITHDVSKARPGGVCTEGDVNWVATVEDAIAHASRTYPDKEIFVIGGAYVYSYCLHNDLIQKIYLTCIHKDLRCDLPEADSNSILRIRQYHPKHLQWAVTPMLEREDWTLVSISGDFWEPQTNVVYDFREYLRTDVAETTFKKDPSRR